MLADTGPLPQADNALYGILDWYRGNEIRLYLDFYRRTFAFDTEWDATPTLEVPPRTKEGVRTTLGFLIGEKWPIAPAWVPVASDAGAAPATHPPWRRPRANRMCHARGPDHGRPRRCDSHDAIRPRYGWRRP